MREAAGTVGKLIASTTRHWHHPEAESPLYIRTCIPETHGTANSSRQFFYFAICLSTPTSRIRTSNNEYITNPRLLHNSECRTPLHSQCKLGDTYCHRRSASRQLVPRQPEPHVRVRQRVRSQHDRYCDQQPPRGCCSRACRPQRCATMPMGAHTHPAEHTGWTWVGARRSRHWSSLA